MATIFRSQMWSYHTGSADCNYNTKVVGKFKSHFADQKFKDFFVVVEEAIQIDDLYEYFFLIF